jgi:hypothetical protein
VSRRQPLEALILPDMRSPWAFSSWPDPTGIDVHVYDATLPSLLW